MARPKLGEGDTQRLHIKISDEELSAIDDWRFANRIASRSEAVRRLVQIGARSDARFAELAEAVMASTREAIALKTDLMGLLPNPLTRSAYTAKVTEILEYHLDALTDRVFDAGNTIVALLTELRPLLNEGDFVDALSSANEKRDAFDARLTEWRDGLKELRNLEGSSSPKEAEK